MPLLASNEYISIIVPVYNTSIYLTQCIQSLLKQTYNYIHILLVDDGSTDDSGKICDDFELQFSMIKVIHKTNGGLSSARNEGLTNVIDDFVLFFDSDDYADSNMVELLINAHKSIGGEFIKGGFDKVNQDGITLRSEVYQDTLFSGTDISMLLIPRMIGSLPNVSDTITFSVCNTLYSMDIIRMMSKEVKPFISEREFIEEDFDFNYRYLQHTNKAMLICSRAYKYRTREGSLTTRYNQKRFDEIIKVYEHICNLICHSDNIHELQDRLYKHILILLRVCITQEQYKISGNGFRLSMNNIRYMCDNHIIREIVTDYPIMLLGKKQSVFVLLIKYKLTFLLYLSAQLSMT